MVEFKRPQFSTLLSRLNEKPRTLIYVIGPRQVGKTTLVLQALNQLAVSSRFVSVGKNYSMAGVANHALVNPNQEDEVLQILPDRKQSYHRWLVREWEKARLMCRQSGQGFILVIDEIQKIPNWSETVKGLWDADRYHDLPLHVVLISSVPVLMQHGLSESLAGRFENLFVGHWSFLEMSEAFNFDLNKFIYFGGYPGGAKLISEQRRWQGYITGKIIESSIEQDILNMQRVDKPVLLKQFFNLGAEFSGQVMSYNKMLGHLRNAGNTTTLARYLDLLSKTGLLTGIEKYSPRFFRLKSSSPKLNVLNSALKTAYSGYLFEEAKTDRSYWGNLVDSAVGSHLINTKSPNSVLGYWQKNNFEVDFVLKMGPKLIAIEVRSGTRRQSLKGIPKFSELFQPTNTIIIGDGGILFSDFFMTPVEDLLELA